MFAMNFSRFGLGESYLYSGWKGRALVFFLVPFLSCRSLIISFFCHSFSIKGRDGYTSLVYNIRGFAYMTGSNRRGNSKTDRNN